jgi:hypothetical protein
MFASKFIAFGRFSRTKPINDDFSRLLLVLALLCRRVAAAIVKFM